MRFSCQKSFLILMACTAALLAGCATQVVAPLPLADPAAIVLDQTLEKKKTAKPVGPEVSAPAPVYGEKVTVTYLGDASVLLADVAKARGPAWSFKVTGPQPRLPIYIQVNAKDVGFNEFMGGVASQLGQRADIALNGTVIELRYRAAS